MKILLIQQKMIGDVLVTSMLATYLKQHYPEVEIHYLIHKSTKDVVLNHPFIDAFILYDPKSNTSISKFFKFSLQLKANKYDAVIDVYSKWSTGLLSFITGAKQRISYHKSYTRFFYTQTYFRENTIAQTNMGLTIEERLSLLKPFQIPLDTIYPPKIYIKEEEKKKVLELLDSYGIDRDKKIFMISIIGSAKNKTYPLSYMAKLVDYVADTEDCTLLFNYIPNQINDAKVVFDACKKETQQKIYFDVLGKSLREFMALMSCCDAIIGNDGGAINMAKALDKPSYIVFSPWIKKESWNTFEDGSYQRSVHIKDFEFDSLKSWTRKQLKERVFEVYNLFDPELFREDLIDFVKNVPNHKTSKYQIADSLRACLN